MLEGIEEPEELLKGKKDAKLVLIDQLAKMGKAQDKVSKELDKLPRLEIQVEMENLKKYNERLEACHIMQRTNNVILKKLTTFVYERLRYVPREED